jgi:hypothetical protein
MLSKVTSIRHWREKRTKVINFAVLDDESYVCSDAVVHNCHRAGQTRHCEVIVLLGRRTLDVDKVETIFGKSLDISKVVTGSDRSTDSEVLRKILAEVHGKEAEPQANLFAVGVR